MNKKSTELNLTEGKPASVILQFAIPILLTSLLQNLYTTIDTIIVGQFVGKHALAGVGSTGAINFLIVGFCMGLCSGFAIPVANRFGAKDYVGLRKTVANCAWTGLGFSVTIAVLVCIFCRQILILMQTPENILEDAYQYIFIIFAGIPITIAYNILAGIMRSLGDSKSPLYFLMMSSVVNIGFDLFSVTVLHMGVRGPAIATLLSQLCSAFLCLHALRTKFSFMKIQKEEWVFEPSYAIKLCGMGVPMGLQYSITAIGSVILQSGINSLGADAVAAVAAAGRINLFLMGPNDSLGSTMATYAGQHVGAKKLDRITQGLKAAGIIGTIYCGFALMIALFFAPQLMLLFVKASETAVIAKGVLFLRLNVAFFVLVLLVNIFRYTIQGMGYSSFAIYAGVLEMIARTLVGIVLIPFFGFFSVCFASPLAWLFADFFLVPAYFSVLKKTKKTLGFEK